MARRLCLLESRARAYWQTRETEKRRGRPSAAARYFAAHPSELWDLADCAAVAYAGHRIAGSRASQGFVRGIEAATQGKVNRREAWQEAETHARKLRSAIDRIGVDLPAWDLIAGASGTLDKGEKPDWKRDGTENPNTGRPREPGAGGPTLGRALDALAHLIRLELEGTPPGGRVTKAPLDSFPVVKNTSNQSRNLVLLAVYRFHRTSLDMSSRSAMRRAAEIASIVLDADITESMAESATRSARRHE